SSGPAGPIDLQVRPAVPPPPLLAGLPAVTVPFPAAGVNVTATPVTGFPLASFTITEGGELTAVPAVADWLVGLFAAIVAAVPAVAVAPKVTGDPAPVACTVCVAAVVPSVPGGVAMPLPLRVAVS